MQADRPALPHCLLDDAHGYVEVQVEKLLF